MNVTKLDPACFDLHEGFPDIIIPKFGMFACVCSWPYACAFVCVCKCFVHECGCLGVCCLWNVCHLVEAFIQSISK